MRGWTGGVRAWQRERGKRPVHTTWEAQRLFLEEVQVRVPAVLDGLASGPLDRMRAVWDAGRAGADAAGDWPGEGLSWPTVDAAGRAGDSLLAPLRQALLV